MNEKPQEQPWLSTAFGLTVLGLGGCLSIYGAESFGENAVYYSLRQLVWLVIGIALYLWISHISFDFWKRSAKWLAGIALAGLLLVLFGGIRINGMQGWFSIGPFLIQPSEFAKGPFLLMLSLYAAQTELPEQKRFLRMAVTGILFCGCVLLEPDFGSATVFFLGLAAVLGLTLKLRYLLALFCGVALPAALVFIFRHGYAMRRFAGYWNPDEHFQGAGWHVKQFQFSMAHGGLFGSEWGGALWSNAYLPLAHSDSAFAAIVESGGLAGGMLVIGGYLAVAWFFRRIALRTEDKAARTFIFATGAMFTAQALLHIGVNTALLPPTGLTLPLFSYGGSSLLATMFAFGLAASAGRSGSKN